MAVNFYIASANYCSIFITDNLTVINVNACAREHKYETCTWVINKMSVLCLVVGCGMR